MNVQAIQTELITKEGSIYEVINNSIKNIKNNSIIAISAKLVSTLEGSIVDNNLDKDKLIIKQSQKYLPRNNSKYHTMHTIIKGTLMLAAGIDESNANKKLILWPKDPLNTAISIRSHIINTYQVKNIGVLIVDSTSKPMRIGTIGTCIASCGFDEIIDYRGTKDLFGRTIEISQQNTAECIASMAVLAMGEGAQRTPMCLIHNPLNTRFNDTAQTSCYNYSTDNYLNDVYEPFFKSVTWHYGGDAGL